MTSRDKLKLIFGIVYEHGDSGLANSQRCKNNETIIKTLIMT